MRDRVEASSQGGWNFGAGHLYHRERPPRRPQVGAGIRLPRLSHKAVLGEGADRAGRESIGGTYLAHRHNGANRTTSFVRMTDGRYSFQPFMLKRFSASCGSVTMPIRTRPNRAVSDILTY